MRTFMLTITERRLSMFDCLLIGVCTWLLPDRPWLCGFSILGGLIVSVWLEHFLRGT